MFNKFKSLASKRLSGTSKVSRRLQRSTAQHSTADTALSNLLP